MTKILIVDDSQEACFLTKSFLEEKGYNVIVSHSGMDALEKVKDLEPDIMLLDLIMMGIDGMEVLRRVRLFNKSIGIIIVSGVINEAISKETLQKGADEYITKPIDYAHLYECILVELIMKIKNR